MFEKGKSANPSTMFQKGQSGNPRGGSKKIRMRDAIMEALGMRTQVSMKRIDLPIELQERLKDKGGRPSKKDKPDPLDRVTITLDNHAAVALAIVKFARKGDASYARLLMDYAEGRPPKTIIHEGTLGVEVQDAREALGVALSAAIAQGRNAGTTKSSSRKPRS